MNVTIVRGRLSSTPRRSELGSGDILVRYEVTVPGDPADSVPVVWIGDPSSAPTAALDRGDEVMVLGRVRRRWFRTAGGPSRSATEVVAERLVPATDRRRGAALVRRARTALE